ncbi:MAG: hypothetical protein FJW30_13975 [Acidobacteria bacterium]|nr:hypothetical protein [Acidobacteriota bacterium]
MAQAPLQLLDDLLSTSSDRQGHSFQEFLKLTDTPVDWAYQIWNTLLGLLKSGDNHQRAIAAQVLSNLAKSDPEGRMVKDLGALLATTRDPRFVTARHCLQSLWKVGIAGEAQHVALRKGLAKRFAECASEKNCTLIRYDILVVLRKMHDRGHPEGLRELAAKLIETEPDAKYKKKYSAVWRERRP